jgi:hypothetical protein
MPRVARPSIVYGTLVTSGSRLHPRLLSRMSAALKTARPKGLPWQFFRSFRCERGFAPRQIQKGVKP